MTNGLPIRTPDVPVAGQPQMTLSPKAQALADLHEAAKANPLVADARDNPANRFMVLGRKGFPMFRHGVLKEEFITTWKQRCCHFMFDASTVGFAWRETNYQSDDANKKLNRFKEGDYRPETAQPPQFYSFDNIGVPMGYFDLVALDFDWPKGVEMPRPADISDEVAVFTYCYSHPCFKMVWDKYVEVHGREAASAWFRSQIISLTTSFGFQLIGRMQDGGPMYGKAPVLVAPFNGVEPTKDAPRYAMDVRYHGNMIVAPGSIVGCKRDDQGSVVRPVRMYEIILGHQLNVTDLGYLLHDVAGWCMAQGGGDPAASISSGSKAARKALPGPEWMNNVPDHGRAPENAAPLIGASETNRTRRDPVVVHSMIDAIVEKHVAENAAIVAAQAAKQTPPQRVLPDFNSFDGTWQDTSRVFAGAGASGELTETEAETAFKYMARLVGGNTEQNEDIWAGKIELAKDLIASGKPCKGLKTLEAWAQHSGWVAPLSQEVVDALAEDKANQNAVVLAQTTLNLWNHLTVGGDDGVIVDAAPQNIWPGGEYGKEEKKRPKPVIANHMEAILRKGFSAKMNTRKYQPYVRIPSALATRYFTAGWHRMDDAVVRLVEKHTSGINVSVPNSPGSVMMNEGSVIRALKAIADEVRYDPALDALKELHATRHTGTMMHTTVGVTHMGCENTPLNREYTRMFFVGLVARVFHPGTKFDLIILLISVQGKGKSSLGPAIAKALGSMEFHTEDLEVGADAKVVMEQTEGIVVAELGEMAGRRKFEHDSVKKFSSKTKDKGRPAYGRSTDERDRSFVMYGTTNDPDPLRDLTGNRRFMPLHVDEIDLEALERDMPSILADAVEDYRMNFAHRPEKIELDRKWWALSTQAQLGATAAPAAVPYVEAILNNSEDSIYRVTTKAGTRYKWIPMVSLAAAMAHQPGSNSLHERSLTDAMKYLGWGKARRRNPGEKNPISGFEKPLSAAEAAAEQVNISAGKEPWSGDGVLRSQPLAINGSTPPVLNAPNGSVATSQPLQSTGTETVQ